MNQNCVLITGSARGIGLAIRKKFTQENYQLLIPSRSEMDLADPVSVDRYLSTLNQQVDILINNAGINILGPADNYSEDDLALTMQVNLYSPMALIKKVVPFMKTNQFGRIVNISSIWSVIAKPNRAVYSITKSALNTYTQNLAIELAPDNILVNAVAPGYVNTELTRKNNSPEEITKIINNIPVKRLAEPEEISELVFFLGTKINTYITGQIILIDGGFSCQ